MYTPHLMTYHSVQQDWKDFQTALEIEEPELVGNMMPGPLSMGCDMKKYLETSVNWNEIILKLVNYELYRFVSLYL